MLNSASRLLLIAVVFAVLYVGVSHVLAFGAADDNYNLARWLLREARRSEALWRRKREMAEAMAVKKAIAQELVAGRLTLREAAEQFREADAMVENDPEGLVAPYLVPETKLGLYQQVRTWTETVLTENYTPQKAEQVRHRLEQEEKEQLGPLSMRATGGGLRNGRRG